MKHLLLVVCLAVWGSLIVVAQDGNKSYSTDSTTSNFIIGYNFSIERDFLMSVSSPYQFETGLSVSHGYRIWSYLYIGGGFGWRFGNFLCIPIFANIKLTPFDRRQAPFFDIKAGYSLNRDENGYFTIFTLGYRVGLGRRQGLTLGVGYHLRTFTVPPDEPNYVPSIYGGSPYIPKEPYPKQFVSVVLGFDL